MKTIRIHTVLTAAAFGLAALTLVPLAAQARSGDRDGPSPARAVERLTRQLDLTDEQRVQVETILEESFEQRRELRERHWAEREATRETTDERLSGVLTGEQMDQLRELREERRDRRCDRGEGRRHGKGPADF